MTHHRWPVLAHLAEKKRTHRLGGARFHVLGESHRPPMDESRDSFVGGACAAICKKNSERVVVDGAEETANELWTLHRGNVDGREDVFVKARKHRSRAIICLRGSGRR